MKRYFITIIVSIFLISTASAEYKITPKDIAKAEKMRAMAVKLKLDKIKPDQLLAGASTVLPLKRELNPEEKKAVECIVKKAQEIQFKTSIEIYARYIADKDFKEKTDTDINESCGLYKLISKK